MTDIVPTDFDGAEDSPEKTFPLVDTPYDKRPNLEELGIIEVERGVCEDTVENRRALRHAMLKWDYVYDTTGNATGHIAARSIEQQRDRAMISINQKKQLLLDPGNINSDFLTGLDLLLDDDAAKIVPGWVLGATRGWQKEQETGGPVSSRRQPAGLPGRCTMIKTDGLRCMLWHSGRIKDAGLCNLHLGSTRRTTSSVDRAREKVSQISIYAVDVLEELMDTAQSEPVKLKAATEILDRAGVRGGIEVGVDINMNERPAGEILKERLDRLRAAAVEQVIISTENGVETEEVYEITDVTPREDGSDPDARN